MINIKERLNNCDVKTKDYSTNVIPNANKILGIKLGDLRLIAKEISKDDYIDYLNKLEFNTYEEEVIYAYVLGYIKVDIKTRINYLKRFIPLIHDWSVCDSLCSNLKVTKTYQTEMYELLTSYIKSKNEFEVRFVTVMLMAYYLNDNYINDVFRIIDSLYLNDYYARMGASWCIATAMAKYPKETLTYLKTTKLDKWTYNKAIQKMIESYRVSDDIKKIIRNMKK